MSDRAPGARADVEPAPTHPEEFKATYDMRIGTFVTLEGTVRLTPANIMTAGLAASAILLSIAVLVHASRRAR